MKYIYIYEKNIYNDKRENKNWLFLASIIMSYNQINNYFVYKHDLQEILLSFKLKDVHSLSVLCMHWTGCWNSVLQMAHRYVNVWLFSFSVCI